MALLITALSPPLSTYAQSNGVSCASRTVVSDWANNPELVSDCEALLLGRDTLAENGSLNWSATNPISQWDGVRLGGAPRRVTELYLRNRQLSGTIPAELGRLSNLEHLRLYGNRMSGEIPPELGSLSNLMTLDLGDNHLYGHIPSELTNLTDLTHVQLHNNQLEGEIPPALGSLSGLVTMDLSGNQLSGHIPLELASLSNLENLLLGNNRLKGDVPLAFGSLSNLMTLHLSGNQLSGQIPFEITNLSNLENLYLDHNTLKGEIPLELSRLSNLVDLRLSANQLTRRIPPELGGLTNLRVLDFGDNRLSGPIPPELGNLTSMEVFVLERNRLTGPIPPELGRLTDLNWLILGDNRLTGPIPSEVGSLSKLTLLKLWSNELSGEIPPELGGLTNLSRVWILSGNQFTGCIPDGLRSVKDNDFHGRGIPFCDVLLDDLVVSPGSLAPSFNRHHDVYIADVTESMVTILPITRYSATFQILSEDGDEITDADGTLPGVQINTGTAFTKITIRVTADDPTATHKYTIGLRRVLGAPTVSAVKAGGGYLTVSWAVPDQNADFRTTSYDLRYIRTTDDETVDSNWMVVRSIWTDSAGESPQYTITGLSAGTQYEMQARAVERGGEPTAWSKSVTGTPTSPGVCVAGGAVTGVTNTGMISDCKALLAARDILIGNGLLDWSPARPIKDWEGITLGRTPLRVVSLAVNSRGLDGTIPSALGELASLQRLYLFENRLTGPIPEELGKLTDLQSLNLSDNRLTGQIPFQLGRLADLRSLLLQDNRLTGVIPSQMSGLRSLDEVDLSGNYVTGCEPPLWNGSVGQAVEYGAPSCFVAEGMVVTVDTSYILAIDSREEGDSLSITAAGDATNGLVTLNGNTITYRHDGSETTTGGFTYTVTNGTEETTASVYITVSPVNDPPVGVEDALAGLEGDAVAVQTNELLVNDFDAEGNSLSITAVGDATNGPVTLNGNTITYRHDGSETTTGGFTYTVTDGTEEATALVYITVSPVNDPPVGVEDALAGLEGDAVAVQTNELLVNDFDAEGDSLSITAVGDATNGLVTLNSNTITYRHDGSETTTGGFTYTVTDGTETASVFVAIAVTPVNDPPVAVDDRATMEEGGMLLFESPALLSNDTDAENAPLQVSAVGDALNGTVSLEGTTIRYQHDGSDTILGSFTYAVSDGIDTSMATVTITVTPTWDFPVVPLIALALGAGFVTVVALVAIRVRRSR